MDNNDERRESFFVCTSSWFDGDCSGGSDTHAVCLGHLTLTEVFEVFESAVDRRVIDYYESIEEARRFGEGGMILKNQDNSQTPSLCFFNDDPGDYKSSVTYEIVCRGLTVPAGRKEPNWVDLRLKDKALRRLYPSVLGTLVNNNFEARTDNEILAKALSAAEELLMSTKILKGTDASKDMTSKELIITRICDRFHSFVLQIKKRHGKRTAIKISDEYDVQDLIHAMLRLFFDDVRPEEYTPSYAGKSSRMDFLLKDSQSVIEVKMARNGLTHKEIGDQLIVDKTRYKKSPDCKHLICFVYDPDHKIDNPRGIEKDLSGTDGAMTTTVLIRPQSD